MEKYRFQNGESVIVKELKSAIVYKMLSGPRKNKAGVYIDYQYVKYNGQLVHIKGKLAGEYLIEEDNGSRYWTDEMFEEMNECICENLL